MPFATSTAETASTSLTPPLTHKGSQAPPVSFVPGGHVASQVAVAVPKLAFSIPKLAFVWPPAITRER